MSGETLYPDCSAVNAVYNDGTSATTRVLPTHTGILRVYVPATAFIVFGTASASVNATTPGTQYNPGTYLASASGCTLFAVAGQNAADFTVNITALVSF